jgi:hypothetical protein
VLLCVGLVVQVVCFQGIVFVSCQSGLVVLRKYEAYNEACLDQGAACKALRHGCSRTRMECVSVPVLTV